jgi:predicted MFS family arabinose efflux permease
MTAAPQSPTGTGPVPQGAWQRMSAAWRSGPLAARNFRLLTGGQLASTAGDFCYAVALPWLVLSTHGGPVLLGTVLACYGVPRTVLIPLAGVLTDRIGARTVMLVADVARCALVAVMTVLATRQIASLAALGPLAALIGAGEGLYIPASYTIMPSLLEPRQLAAGNGINLAAIRAGSLLGPAIGGSLVAAVGSAPAFAVDAGSFAVSALTLALIPRRRTAAASTGAGKVTESEVASANEQATGTASGFGQNGDTGKLRVPDLLRRSRAMQVFVVVTIVANLTGGGLAGVALPSLAHARYGPAGYGALLACLAAGGLVGTLAAARTGNLRRPSIVGALSFVVYAASMGLVPYLGGEAGAAAALFVFGGTQGFGNVIFFTAGQRWTPPYVLGRVMGLMMLCLFGTYPLSVALAGILVHHLGPTLYFPIAGALTGAAFLGGLSQREYRDFGAADADGSYLLVGLKGLNKAVADPATTTAT